MLTLIKSAKFAALSVCVAVLAACGGGGEPTLVASPTSIALVQVSGVASYESVPINPVTGGLNYAATVNKPMRGITVQAIANSQVVASTVSSNTGSYVLSIPANTVYSIRVRAELVSGAGAASWNVAVFDNTNQDALWTAENGALNSGNSNSVRNITAGSGWTGTAYNDAARVAGEFAILDTIYTGMQKILAINPNIQFPPLVVFWSPNNKPVDGDVTLGEIRTSLFTQKSTGRYLFVLGEQGVDTDEYDTGVVAHEYGHYLQSAFSTFHSLGGQHGGVDKLDKTVAFGEAWGYAWAGLALNLTKLNDSSGVRQANGGFIDLAAPTDAARGWYREDAVQSIIYDLGASQGFVSVWNAFTGAARTSQNALDSIFQFAAAVRSAGNTTVNTMLNNLLTAQNLYYSGSVWWWRDQQWRRCG
jgi:hypothetical protein